VVAAHHIHLDHRVAIKFLLPQALASKEAVARFAREARAAVKIKGEHVARVTDVGTLENGSPYMVMEYLEGSDLSQWVERSGPLRFEQAAEFVLQACEAIAEAHALGIVHRDLKPANLFVVRRPDGSLSVKVLDFGISKSPLAAGSSGMTHTFAIMGSPLYMSPEQIQSSKDVDSRTDIWALGAVLYELVTGHSPFVAETLTELAYQIISQQPPPLRDKRADASLELERVILKCLEKDRAQRFQSVAELATALVQLAPARAKVSVERIFGILHAAGMAEAYHAPSLPGAGSAEVAALIASPWARTTGRSRGLTTVLIVVGIIAAAVTALFVSRQSKEPDRAPLTVLAQPRAVPPTEAPKGMPPQPSRASTPRAENPPAAADDDGAKLDRSAKPDEHPAAPDLGRARSSRAQARSAPIHTAPSSDKAKPAVLPKLPMPAAPAPPAVSAPTAPTRHEKQDAWGGRL
jgi:serine/threonine-protein kinase